MSRRLDGGSRSEGAGSAGAGAGTSTTVWILPSSTSFSCLCEACLESARRSGLLFADALTRASVRGDIGADVQVASRRCRAGHEIVLRRVERPPALTRPDERQLVLR